MTLEEILAQVQMGGLSPEAAGKLIRQDGYKEMDYAKLDTGRKARTGFAEVIYCCNKADAHLLKIFERLYMEEGEVLGTRASQAQYELVKEKFPEVQYDPVSRILKIEKPDKIHGGKGGCLYCRHCRYSSGRGSSTDCRIFWNSRGTDL